MGFRGVGGIRMFLCFGLYLSVVVAQSFAEKSLRFVKVWSVILVVDLYGFL